MDSSVADILISRASEYNNPLYFKEDPIIFPRHFAELVPHAGACLQDVEIAGLLAAHLAWGRREMIVRDSRRMFDQMGWKPYEYVMNGRWKDDPVSLHRTIKWSGIAEICSRLQRIYRQQGSIENLSIEDIRCGIFGSKADRNAANKKINMFRRWMVRRDGIVDLGLWKSTDPADLLIPLDVHVHRCALELGLTSRKSADACTVREITDCFREIFPGDPCLGDFALFGYGVSHKNDK